MPLTRRKCQKADYNRHSEPGLPGGPVPKQPSAHLASLSSKGACTKTKNRWNQVLFGWSPGLAGPGQDHPPAKRAGRQTEHRASLCSGRGHLDLPRPRGKRHDRLAGHPGSRGNFKPGSGRKKKSGLWKPTTSQVFRSRSAIRRVSICSKAQVKSWLHTFWHSSWMPFSRHRNPCTPQ